MSTSANDKNVVSKSLWRMLPPFDTGYAASRAHGSA
jgi:hypothetical protein